MLSFTYYDVLALILTFKRILEDRVKAYTILYMETAYIALNLLSELYLKAFISTNVQIDI